MSESQSESQDSIESRTERALTECMTVLPNKGRADGAPGLFIVIGENGGGEYLVDTCTTSCECDDDKYNLDDREACKHVRRARIATGDRPVPASALDSGNISIDDTFGAHVDASPKFATADGGIIDGETNDVVDDSDDESAIWSDPRPEIDKFGSPTGAHVVECLDCGVETTTSLTEFASHREECRHADENNR
jgi:hypothetical protein